MNLLQNNLSFKERIRNQDKKYALRIVDLCKTKGKINLCNNDSSVHLWHNSRTCESSVNQHGSNYDAILDYTWLLGTTPLLSMWVWYMTWDIWNAWIRKYKQTFLWCQTMWTSCFQRKVRNRDQICMGNGRARCRGRMQDSGRTVTNSRKSFGIWQALESHWTHPTLVSGFPGLAIQNIWQAYINSPFYFLSDPFCEQN